MNEKVNRIYEEEKVINLSDLCLFVLKKWKLMLIGAIVFAIVAATLFSYKDYQSYQKSKNMTEEEEIAQLGVPADQREIVHMKMETFESYMETIREYEYYYNNSIKVKLDPNNVNQGTAIYIVSTENAGDALKVASVCERKLFSEEVYTELAQQLSEPVDVAMLKEVIVFSKNYATNSYGEEDLDNEVVLEYVVSVRHFNQEDCALMLDFVVERMEELPELLAAENLNVELEKVSEKLAKVCDKSIATLSKDVRTAVQNCYDFITATKVNLNDAQKKYYDYLMAKETAQNQENVEKTFKDFIDIKMVVLGGIAGAMVVAVAYAVLYLLDKRIHNKEELQSWISTPVIGLEDGADLMLTFLAGVVKTNQIEHICLTGTLENQSNGTLQKVKDMLEVQGCEVLVGSNVLKKAETLQNAVKCENMILFEKCNVSKEKDIKDVLMKASSCGIHVLSIVLER